MHRLKPSKPLTQQGFTLFEILVTVLIVSFGLLGLASLQMLGVKNAQSGNLRSQVSFLANDIMDRMQANPTGTFAGDYDVSTTAVAPDTTPVITEFCFGISKNCSPQQLASYDVWVWRSYLANYLPGGTGSIVRDVSNPDNLAITITIQWVDGYLTEGTDNIQTATFSVNYPI